MLAKAGPILSHTHQGVQLALQLAGSHQVLQVHLSAAMPSFAYHSLTCFPGPPVRELWGKVWSLCVDTAQDVLAVHAVLVRRWVW